jgi:hypothetical protein
VDGAPALWRVRRGTFLWACGLFAPSFIRRLPLDSIFGSRARFVTQTPLGRISSARFADSSYIPPWTSLSLSPMVHNKYTHANILSRGDLRLKKALELDPASQDAAAPSRLKKIPSTGQIFTVFLQADVK